MPPSAVATHHTVVARCLSCQADEDSSLKSFIKLLIVEVNKRRSEENSRREEEGKPLEEERREETDHRREKIQRNRKFMEIMILIVAGVSRLGEHLSNKYESNM